MEDSYLKTTNEMLKHFHVDPKSGLTQTQVSANLAKYGKNELPEEESTPLWKLILEQFQDQLVIILLIAAIISFVLAFFEEDHGDSGIAGSAFVEPIVILLILIANATVGVIQESNAEKAIDALKKYSPDECKVLRDGQILRLPAEELVPGDVIDVSVGDKIPADCRMLEILSSSFSVDQSILTGESVSVTKDTAPIKDKNAVKQDMINIIFSGTTISAGKARAVVVKTGINTAIGDIHQSITSQISEKTPLKQKLDDFGDQLAKVISVVCILVWAINIQHFSDPSHHGWLKGAVYYFKIAVALAVAAIPEGLAVVITTCLALGTKKMAKKNAIVRSLPSVETLGCTSVICSDKTGTLTTNQMSVCNVLLIHDEKASVEEYEVTGTSYGPYGEVHAVSSATSAFGNSAVVGSVNLAGNPVLNQLSTVCSLCNEASVSFVEESDSFVRVGEPTEVALRVLAEKLKTDDSKFNASLSNMSKKERAQACNGFIAEQYQKLATMEFSRDRKSMSVLLKKAGVAGKKGKKSAKDNVLFVKGAPESILERCDYVRLSSSGEAVKLNAAIRSKIMEAMQEYGNKRALRCLAIATVDDPKSVEEYDFKNPKNYVKYESNLTFVGLVAMEDPPRPEVRDAIAKCHSAGIRVIVITGDNKNTAESICRQIGIFEAGEDLTGKSYTGRELDSLSKEDKVTAALNANLFSRTEPTHKCELVELLQKQGYVVAMTGDGVNDAPALKKADIGVAMGTGTDVSKLAADMVLADDNFSTIVSAVEEGRSIYNNTKQFIRYLISSNIGEVVSIFLTALLGMPEALIPVQLLWVNLVTDGLPATALGFNPADHEIMHHAPRTKTEPIVGRWLFIRYVIIGTYVGAATVFGYAWWFMFYSAGPQLSFAQLTSFSKCAGSMGAYSCGELFGPGSIMMTKASTMSLSILVVIEMLNALNSLSENESIFSLPPWKNIYLIGAVFLSMALHLLILYVPWLSTLFSITSLNLKEWEGVLLISLPVLIIDEFLKWVSRNFVDQTIVHHQVKHSVSFKSSDKITEAETPSKKKRQSIKRSKKD